jgi:hypothetical protein
MGRLSHDSHTYYAKLRLEIASMTPRMAIFKLLKHELSILGYWKNKSRGNPSKGFKHSYPFQSQRDKIISSYENTLD